MIGVISRLQAGLRAPISRSRDIQPGKGGVAVHWAGGGVGDASNHRVCLAAWRGFQAHHMAANGWVDIAYNFGFCQHGFVFVGRGLGVRSAANGTNQANDGFYAAVWIGGEGDAPPTEEAIGALEWIITAARKDGAGDAVKPHGSFVKTACPGPALTAVANRLNGKPAPAKPAKSQKGIVQLLQEAVGVTADGKWGPRTDSALMGVRQGKRPRAAVVAIQAALRVTPDGDWGPLTDHAFMAARRAHLGRF